MDNLITFISKFEGIIGALMGVVATLITTQLIKNLGKLYFYFYDYHMDYYGKSEYGITGGVNDVTKANSCAYNIRMQLYNSSETIKILKDMQIVFVLGNKRIYSKPNNVDDVVKHEVYSEYKDFNFINVPPKKLIEINMRGSIEDEDMVEVSKVNKIYFIGKNHKNRKIKKIIKKF